MNKGMIFHPHEQIVATKKQTQNVLNTVEVISYSNNNNNLRERVFLTWTSKHTWACRIQ